MLNRVIGELTTFLAKVTVTKNRKCDFDFRFNLVQENLRENIVNG